MSYIDRWKWLSGVEESFRHAALDRESDYGRAAEKIKRRKNLI